jgi:HK97 gp10 family phage protein
VKITMKIDGLSEIQAALRELPKVTSRDIMKRVLAKYAKPVEETVRSLAPVDTGRLKRSIRMRVRATGGDHGKAAFAAAMSSGASRSDAGRAAREANRGKSGTVEVRIGAWGIPYAHLQEFGAPQHGPQAFLRPALDQHKDRVIANVTDDMWREIRSVFARRAKKAAKKAARVR